MMCKKGYRKPLALYYLIKAKYSHSIIYSYSYAKLSSLTGLHSKTIQRYINVLIKEDLVEERDGNLLFRKASKVLRIPFDKNNPKKQKFATTCLSTRPYMSFKGMLNRIEFLTINNNLHQQKYNISLTYGIGIGEMKPHTKRKILKNVKIDDMGLESIKRPVITIGSVSRLFKCSNVTAIKIIRKLIQHNYISTKALVEFIGYIKKDARYLGGNYFNKGKALFRYVGREVEKGRYVERLLENPRKLLEKKVAEDGAKIPMIRLVKV